MVYKGKLDIDPRGLIYESYRIRGIKEAECRTIFLDWTLGMPDGADMAQHITELLETYAPDAPDHPMTRVLQQGIAEHNVLKGRRGGAMGRRRNRRGKPSISAPAVDK